MSVNKIMIYAEVQQNCGTGVGPAYYELLSKAKELYEKDGAEFSALLLGSGLAEIAQGLTASGVDSVYVLDDPKLAVFNCEYYAAAAAKAIGDFGADLVFFGATSCGEELAPTVALRFKTAGAAHCVDFVRKPDGSLAHMVPAFGGKVIGEIFIKSTTPQIASSKPGLFTAKAEAAKACVINAIDPKVIDFKSRIAVKETGANEVCGIPLTSATAVVCGGFGIGGEENFERVRQLAEKLGGAVGCTRPAVDKGWADENRMVGTSGQSIKPKLYLGFGISGAAHHLCGIKNAGTIISVNSDPAAEVFAASDYKVVADANKLIPMLLEKLG